MLNGAQSSAPLGLLHQQAKINVNSAAIGKSSEAAITTAVVRDEVGTFLVIVMKRITNLETLEMMFSVKI